MKKLILFLVSSMVCTGYTHAQLVPFEYTGATAVKTDAGWESVPGSNPGPIGGPIGKERFGVGEQFTLTEARNIDALAATINVIPDEPGTITFNYNLYTNSSEIGGKAFPDANSLALTSENLTFSLTSDQVASDRTQTFQENIPFNIDLPPGTYWLSQEGAGGPEVTTAQEYVIAPVSQSTAVAPEPSSVWLMLFGLAAALIFKRRVQFGI